MHPMLFCVELAQANPRLPLFNRDKKMPDASEARKGGSAPKDQRAALWSSANHGLWDGLDTLQARHPVRIPTGPNPNMRTRYIA
jgi:hypothetical protein